MATTTNELNSPIGKLGIYRTTYEEIFNPLVGCVVKVVDTRKTMFGGLKYLVEFGITSPYGGPKWVPAGDVDIPDSRLAKGLIRIWDEYKAFEKVAFA